MEKEHFKMSTKETNRISVIENLANGKVKARQAAQNLGISIRQVRRLKKSFVRFGITGLIHKGRGRSGNRAIPKKEIERVLTIVQDKYSDFGPTFALEKLKENHGVLFGRETLRLAMIEKGIWKPKKKRYIIIHQQRRRRDREGELIQLDGSPHLWFEDRGPSCTLLVFVDDATGKLKHLMFAKAETTNDYFRAMSVYIRKFGKPVALYVDKHGVFRINTKRSGMAACEDSNGLTQFGRAMQELGITIIFANTPQAKGRVEKMNRTLQNRLVKEMRLKGISSMAKGNAFLVEFMDTFNRKFAHEPFSKEDAHLVLLPSENLGNILLKKETRILSKNLEFQHKNHLYQLTTDRPLYSMRHAPITILEDWDGNIRVYYKGQGLKFKVVEKLPFLKIADAKEIYQDVEKVLREPWKPAKDHPWRNYTSP